MLLEDFTDPHAARGPVADPFVDRRARVRVPKPVAQAAAPDPDAGARRYEEGYKQGWDDAAARIRDDDTRVGARAATRIEGMAHTQRAAMALCLAQIEPMLTEVFDKLLPRAADRGFLGIVMQEAEAMLRDADGHALSLRLAPEALEAVRATLIEGGADLAAVRLEPDPELEPLQAVLSHPGAEREVDVARMLDALDGAFEDMRKTVRTATHD